MIVTNPEVSSVRDSDRIIGILNSKSRRAERGEEPVKQHLLLTRYDTQRVDKGEMLKVEDARDPGDPAPGRHPPGRLGAAGVNVGMPVVLDERSKAGQAYTDAVRRLVGEQIEMRFTAPAKRGFVQWLLRRAA